MVITPILYFSKALKHPVGNQTKLTFLKFPVIHLKESNCSMSFWILA